MKNFFREFKEFIARGNMLELAVAVILGGAVGAIIKSLVNDILMPLIGMALGGNGVAEWKVTVGTATLSYGLFIQAIINFVIIGLVLFIIIKAMNKTMEKMKKKKDEEKVVEEPDKTEVLLTEIRDLLKK